MEIAQNAPSQDVRAAPPAQFVVHAKVATMSTTTDPADPVVKAVVSATMQIHA